MIETKRLIFREYTHKDFDDLSKIICDEETMKHYPKPYDSNGVTRWIDWNLDNYSKYGFGLWALELKGSHEFIGDCGITMQKIDGKLLPEIGYHINKKYWQQGYGKEAASAVRDWAFNNTNFPALYSYMNATNIASYSLAKSIGLKQIKEYDDGDEHLYVYQITRDDYCKSFIK